jgi:hypothetical protein
MIVVSTPVTAPQQVFCISSEEDWIVRRVRESIGVVAAIRVARSFAKSDLRSANDYVMSLNSEQQKV